MSLSPVSQLFSQLRERLRLDEPDVQNALREFCERHHILKLSVFGSVLRDDFREGGDDPSDIDVLVELDQEHIPGWDYYVWGDELAVTFGRKVDVSSALHPCTRERVLHEAVTIGGIEDSRFIFHDFVHVSQVSAFTLHDRLRSLLCILDGWLDEAQQFNASLQRAHSDQIETAKGALEYALTRIGNVAAAVQRYGNTTPLSDLFAIFVAYGQEVFDYEHPVSVDRLHTIAEKLPDFRAAIQQLERKLS